MMLKPGMLQYRKTSGEESSLRSKKEKEKKPPVKLKTASHWGKSEPYRSEEKYRLLIETSLDGVLLTAPDGSIFAANPAACQMLKRTEKEIIRVGRNGVVDTTDPQLPLAIQECARTGHFRGELTMVRKNGVKFSAEISTSIFLDNKGYERMSMIIRDTSERKKAEFRILQLNRLYTFLSQINQKIVRVKDRAILFKDICQVAIDHGKYRMAWIGLIDKSDNEVKPVVFAGEEQGYLAKVSIKYLDEELGRGPTGTAIREGRCVICQNIATDPRLKPWREPALKRGYRSSASVPIREQGCVIGTLSVYAEEPEAFKDEDEKLLDEIGRDISFALDSMKVEEQRKQMEEKLIEARNWFSSIIRHSPHAIIVTDPKGHVSLWNEAAERIFGWNEEEVVGKANPIIPEDLMEEVQKVRKNVLSGKTEINTETVRRHKNGKSIQVSFSASPLKDDQGEITSILAIIQDITERKQAEARIHLQLERLTALKKIDQAIMSSFDKRVSLNILITQAIEQLDVDAADILLLNEQEKNLIFGVGFGFKGEGNLHLKLPLGEGYAGEVALLRQGIHIPDLSLVEHKPHYKDLPSGEGFISYHAIPLISKDKVVGVLEVFHRTQLNPDNDWLEFLDTLAGQAAIAIENIDMFNNLQRSRQELIIAYDATIEGWSRAMDIRDKETEGHTLRVTEMSLQLGNKMGLTKEELINMRRGALLHDIGKIGIPDGILLKPGKLTEEEWVLMKEHPNYAYAMLAPIHYLGTAVDVPYCHHEKWDGTGYPRGLMGEQIPLSARIFAVVDVWDALTSDRPYRKAWSKPDALKYIREQSGRHFDPRAVEIFLEEFGNR